MPMASPSARRTRAQSAWNVPADDIAAGLADEADDPLAELGGGAVREGHGQDPPRRDVLDADEVRDPVGEDPGLAGAGAGQDEERALGRRDGAGLLRVERADDLRGAVAPSLPPLRPVGRQRRAPPDRRGTWRGQPAASRAPRASQGPRRGRRMPSRRAGQRPPWHRRARGRRSGDDGRDSPVHCRSGAYPTAPVDGVVVRERRRTPRTSPNHGGRSPATRHPNGSGRTIRWPRSQPSVGATWSGGGAVTVTGSSHFENVTSALTTFPSAIVIFAWRPARWFGSVLLHAERHLKRRTGEIDRQAIGRRPDQGCAARQG